MRTRTPSHPAEDTAALQACPNCGSFTITTSAALAAQAAAEGRCGSCAFGGAE